MGHQVHGDYQVILWTTRSQRRRKIRLWWDPGSSAKFGPHTIFAGSRHQGQDPPIWPTLPSGFLCKTELVLALLTLPDTLPLPLYTQVLVQSPPPHPPIQGIPGGNFWEGETEEEHLRSHFSGPAHSLPAGHVPTATTDSVWSSSTWSRNRASPLEFNLSCL